MADYVIRILSPEQADGRYLGKTEPVSESALPARLSPATLDSTFVNATGAESIAGVKTFSSSPIVPDGSFGFPKVSGLQTALDGKATLPDMGTKAVGKGEIVINVKDYGTSFSAVGGGGDDTAAFQAAVTAAALKGGSVLVPCGTYKVENLVIPDFVVLVGAGEFTRFIAAGNPGLPGGSRAATRLVRPGASPGTSVNPMVTVAGSGAGLRNIQIEGGGAPGTILEMQGFETVLEDVNVISGTGIGIDVQKANNVKWAWVFVNNCGSATLPAMRMWSKTGAGGIANETNNVDIFMLTIERSGGTALQVAVGADSTQYWVEWLRIYGLHIENGIVPGVENFSSSNPLVEIGNVRSVEVFGYMLYGGPGYIVSHNQVATRGYGNGGIRFIGGTMLGQDPAYGTTTPIAIGLVAGTGFKVIGGRFNRIGTQVVGVNSTYGKYAITNCDTDVQIQPKPSISASGMTAVTVLTGSDDRKGRVFFTTGASPAAGVQATITYYHAIGNDASIILTPKTGPSQQMGLYSVGSAGNDTFSIRAANVPAASTGMQVDYQIIPFDL